MCLLWATEESSGYEIVIFDRLNTLEGSEPADISQGMEDSLSSTDDRPLAEEKLTMCSL